jgi:hypothetical protein
MRASSRPFSVNRPSSLCATAALCLAVGASLGCSSADEADRADVAATSSIEGKLAVYQTSFKDGSSAREYGLRREGLPEVKLALGSALHHAPGTRIKVAGSFGAHGEFVASSVELARDDSPVGTTSSAITQPTQTRSVGVLLVRTSNEPEPPPWLLGTDKVANSLFGTATPDFPANPQNADAYYREVSYGARALTGTIFNWITIDPLADNCDTDVLRQRALAKASESGIDLSPFEHVAIIVTAGCGNIAGRGELGTPAAPGRYTWYYYEAGAELFIHELGHNFGFSHALAYDCTSESGEPVPISTTDRCSENPSFPQDPWDPMGYRSFAHLGAYNKMLQGWLAGANVVTAGASGGDFTLEPLEIATSAPQLLRVPADPSLCPADIRPCYYYVEYRQPIGFDGIPSFVNSGMHDGALLRLGSEIDPTQHSMGRMTRMLEMSPSSITLRVGETLEDPTGLRITTVATPTAGDHQQLVLRVSRASRVSATFTFSSGQSGTTGSYCGEVKVTNTSATTVNGGWRVRLNLNESQLTSGWNGTFTSGGNSLYDLTPVPWNSTIEPGQFVSAGFCADKTGANFTPQVVFSQSN